MLSFLPNVCRKWSLILRMTRLELVSHTAGNVAGMAWMVVRPVLIVLTYYFVFSFALRLGFQGDRPYLLMLIAGLVPWLTFSDTLSGSAISVTGNPHLVKKIVFPIEVLVPITFMTALVAHVCMLVVLVGLIYLYGYELGIYALQIPYYLLALGVFSVGLGWLVSAYNVAYRDTSEALAVLLNLWFWVTPVVWPVSVLPSHYQWVAKLNPLYYVVEGYRKSLILNEPFWGDSSAALFFWVQAFCILALGIYSFRSLKSEFAELS